MNRLRRPGDSDYDVLGISPEATDEEIEGAFSRLIEEQGYKADVPLRSQWARAREIKAAYATLADPARRQAYNESLGLPSDPSAWLATSKDSATDELVVSEVEPEASEPASLNGVRHERVPDLALQLDEQDGTWFHDRPPPPYLAPAQNDNEPAPVRHLRMARAAAFGLGVMLIASFPWWNIKLPSGENVRKVIADAVRTDPDASSVGHPPAQVPRSVKAPSASATRGRGVPDRSSPPSSPALPRPVEAQNATGERITQRVSEPAASVAAAAQPPADTTPTEIAPATAEPSAAPAEPAEEKAAAPEPPQRSAEAPATANAPPRVRPPPRFTAPPVRRQARWLGGGPTNADNRRGLYQGTVNVQVSVGQNGRVSSCAPVRGSGNPGLDALTCRLVRQRARFAPALDAQGRPVASQAYATFVWGSTPRR